MLTRMPDCSLPSLFGACHEEPSRAGGKGFDLWPKTKWIWSFQLRLRSDNLLTKLHRGKSLYLSMQAASIFDPLVRAEIDQASGDDSDLLEYLGGRGPSMNEDVELELGWDRKRLKRARVRLEQFGAVISDGLVFESSSDWYFAPMRRWDQVVPRSAASDDPFGDVVVAGVRAAVITPESNVASWFSWTVPPGAVDRLVDTGRLMRPAPGMLTIAG